MVKITRSTEINLTLKVDHGIKRQGLTEMTILKASKIYRLFYKCLKIPLFKKKKKEGHDFSTK